LVLDSFDLALGHSSLIHHPNNVLLKAIYLSFGHQLIASNNLSPIFHLFQLNLHRF